MRIHRIDSTGIIFTEVGIHLLTVTIAPTDNKDEIELCMFLSKQWGSMPILALRGDVKEICQGILSNIPDPIEKMQIGELFLTIGKWLDKLQEPIIQL
jgi:hypothetical protein